MLSTIGLSDLEVQTFVDSTGFKHVHDLRSITVTDFQSMAKQARSNEVTFPLLSKKLLPFDIAP